MALFDNEVPPQFSLPKSLPFTYFSLTFPLSLLLLVAWKAEREREREAETGQPQLKVTRKWLKSDFRILPKVTLKVARKATFWPPRVTFEALLASKSYVSGQNFTFRVTFRVTLGDRKSLSFLVTFQWFFIFRGFGGFRMSAFSQVESKEENPSIGKQVVFGLDNLQPAKSKKGREEGDGTENVINCRDVCRKLSWHFMTTYDDLWRFMTFYVNGIKRRKLSWNVANCRDMS